MRARHGKGRNFEVIFLFYRGGFIFGNPVTGIIDPGNVNSRELTASPIPAHDQLMIRHPASPKNTVLRFIDFIGREVKTVMPMRNATTTSTSVAYLKPGIYTIVWTDGVRYLSRLFSVQ